MNIYSKFKPEDYRLCYISGDFAYFTTQPLSKQHGDDWDDSHYEHNAGPPYTWLGNDEEEFSVVMVAFKGDFYQPKDQFTNSPFSVEQINMGVIAWLRPTPWSDHKTVIHAGVTLPKFIMKVNEAKGEVFIPSSWS